MTNLVGTITNSTGTPLGGVLTVALPAIVTDDSTAPDTIYTTVPQTFTITAGELDIDLPETETTGTPYKFTFRPTGATDDLFSIHAIVPNVAVTEFAPFFPTGITDRTLDTSALRVGRILATDPVLSQLVKQPAIFSVQTDGLTGSKTYFVGKPFEGSILIRSLTILGISGYTNWAFSLGVINSSGNEETLTPVTTATVAQSGRRRIQQTYNISRAGSIMGLFVNAEALAGSTALNATLSISYTELN
jgi:hypothetical protein